jgi:hypothetical protein
MQSQAGVMVEALLTILDLILEASMPLKGLIKGVAIVPISLNSTFHPPTTFF